MTARVEQDIVLAGRTVLGELRAAVVAASEGAGELPERPFPFAKATGLQKDVVNRLFAALKARDDFAALHHLPGQKALREVLEVCHRHGASAEVVSRGMAALARFESTVTREFGSRSGLEAYVASMLPEARRSQLAASKQALYRGAVGLKGVTSEVISVLFVCAPNKPDPAVGDTFVVNGTVGLHRVRPGAIVQFSSAEIEMATERRDEQQPARPAPEEVSLPDWCEPAPLPFDVTRTRTMRHYQLRDVGVGPQTAINYFSGELCRRMRLLVSDRPDLFPQYFCATIDHPTKLLVFDTLMHKSVWPNATASVRVYDTSLYGLADVRNPMRDKDILDMDERIEVVTSPPSRWRSQDVPRYSELCAVALERLGYPESEYVCYSIRTAYPPYGSQYALIFQPPGFSPRPREA